MAQVRLTSSLVRSCKMMNINYELVKNEGEPSYVISTDANGKVWSIPCDPANSDYQAYLEHLTEIVSE